MERSGESLAGRYFHYHLNPLSVRELDGLLAPFDAVEKLENTVAVSLLKHIQFEQDYAGKRVSLSYARTKDSTTKRSTVSRSPV